MPSVKKVLFFKKVAIILSILWTMITYVFFVYQIHTEQRHIKNEVITNAKDITRQAEYIIRWAFDQKAKHQVKQAKLELKTDFSLRDLIYKMSAERGAVTVIEGNYLEDDFTNLNKQVKNTLQKMQKTKTEQFAFYLDDNKKYIFFAKPLLDDGTCSKCHVHDDKKKGDLLGNVNLKMQIPSFEDYKKDSYLFITIMYSSTWLFGLGIIWFIRHRNKIFYEKSVRSYEESIYALVDMMERRDSYTAGHSKRVATYAAMIADEYGCSDEEVDKIYRAGMLHDIGKVEIPDALLLKPDKLDDDEYDLIKTHAKFGYELLLREPFSELSSIVLHHHERYDGRGYPYGLKGEEIPFLSAIISVADAFDAMTTNRAYRESFSIQKALQILEEESGKQFNPKIIVVALKALKNVKSPEDTTQMPKNPLEEMRFSYYFKDQLTNCYNSSYLKFLLTHKQAHEKICVYHVNCKNFTKYNKQHGWNRGNILLKEIANAFKQNYKDTIVIRVFGDNFFLVTLEKHLTLNERLLDPLVDGKNINIEYKHMDLGSANIHTVEDLEDKLLQND